MPSPSRRRVCAAACLSRRRIRGLASVHLRRPRLRRLRSRKAGPVHLRRSSARGSGKLPRRRKHCRRARLHQQRRWMSQVIQGRGTRQLGKRLERTRLWFGATRHPCPLRIAARGTRYASSVSRTLRHRSVGMRTTTVCAAWCCLYFTPWMTSSRTTVVARSGLRSRLERLRGRRACGATRRCMRRTGSPTMQRALVEAPSRASSAGVFGR